MARTPLSEGTIKMLRCPACLSRLDFSEARAQCASCRKAFPVLDGIPVLINDSESIFSIKEIVQSRNAVQERKKSGIKGFISGSIPDMAINMAENNSVEFVRLVQERESHPRILIIGGGTFGAGVKKIVQMPGVEFIESDVYFGPRTNLICDCHSIPLRNESVDGVIIQAVLEHVVDPYRCAEEIYRTLKKGGLVYADTPFMQQTHGGRHDFTRFTYLGHRRLFRKFEEIRSGITSGPAGSLAWSTNYFFASFFRSRFFSAMAHAASSFAFFWLKYFDYMLMDKPESHKAACGFFFIGAKSEKTLSDRELVKLYKNLRF